jgi:hypothetical protein
LGGAAAAIRANVPTSKRTIVNDRYARVAQLRNTDGGELR